MTLSGKGGTGVVNGIREGSKTPRGTYTSHPIPIKHYLSSPPIHTPTLSPCLERHLSASHRLFPPITRASAARTSHGLSSSVNREEAGNGERMKVGHRLRGLYQFRKNLKSR